ncbi:MAG: hypothetical protein HC780_28080 [Leptolyngbyaceae cyanobacterium CSU_1_3]|nr:hypothetical protein [Leptolyngbyaceae cyanobacterium CSU_1_3]
MSLTIARKLWVLLVLVSVVAVGGLGYRWINQPLDNEGDYQQSLKVLFQITDSGLRSIEYKRHKPAGS